MNLATSQRPHPPPVPPRPSRQVVAEALKRTCKPPCPTRQAPPPPNVRPWRYEDQENVIGSKGGRTVVYDSGKGRQMNGEEIRCSSEPRSLNELKRPLALPRCCNDETFSYGSGINASSENTAAFVEKTEERCSGGPTQATSERNEAENQREWHYQRQQQLHNRRSNGNERRDHENSAIKLNKSDSEISVKDNRRSISDDNILAHKEKGNYSIGSFLLGRKKNTRREVKDDGFCEEKKKRLFDKLRSRNNDEYSKISVKEEKRLSDGCVNENVVKLAEIERTENLNENGKRSQRCSLSFGKKTDSQGKIMAVTKLLKTATKIEKNSTANVINDGGKVIDGWNINEEPISRKVEEEEEEEAPSGSVTTNSSDDCATVVVIDEADRKIGVNEDNDNIHHQDWLEAGIRYSSTKITLPGDDPVDHEFSTVNDSRGNDDEEEYDEECLTYDKLDYKSIRERIAMSSLQGLPPLPRSLSGFNLSEGRREAADPPPPPTRSSSKTQKNIVKSTQPSSTRPSPPGRQLTTLDTQLAILRKEMFGLRQLDLSLLSQLWSLNESIQEFRQLLQEQEDRAPSPSPSSEEGDDNSYGSHPPPPLRRPAPLLHHHRPPRPPRPLRPPTSDDSPSSEEYGAV